MKILHIYLLFASLCLSIVVTEYVHALNSNFSGLITFGQRYGANSFITTQPLYFKEIDSHGHIIRPHARFITAPPKNRYIAQHESHGPLYSTYEPDDTMATSNHIEQATEKPLPAQKTRQIEQVISPAKTRDDYYNYANRFKRFAFGISRWFHH